MTLLSLGETFQNAHSSRFETIGPECLQARWRHAPCGGGKGATSVQLKAGGDAFRFQPDKFSYANKVHTLD